MKLKNPKARGNKAEREIWHLMLNSGYDSICSKASLGPADVVAWNNEEIRFIQSKNENRRGSHAADIDKLAKMKCPPNGTRELWMRQRGGHTWERQTILPDGTIKEDTVTASNGTLRKDAATAPLVN